MSMLYFMCLSSLADNNPARLGDKYYSSTNCSGRDLVKPQLGNSGADWCESLHCTSPILRATTHSPVLEQGTAQGLELTKPESAEIWNCPPLYHCVT